MLRPRDKQAPLIARGGLHMFNDKDKRKFKYKSDGKTKCKGKGKSEQNLQTELNRQTTEGYGVSELHELVRTSDLTAVETYLKNNPEHLNLLDSNHTTAACLAAQTNNLALLSMLAEKDGIDFTTGDFDGNTPMSWAKKHGNKEMIVLIKNVKSFERPSDDVPLDIAGPSL